MHRKRKLFARSVAVVGVALAVFASTFLFENLCRLRFAENLILREESRAESAWELVETPSGHLIRMRHGKFKDWFLAADELVDFTGPPPRNSAFVTSLRPVPRPASAYVRNVILQAAKGSDCYWKLTETERGVRVQAARGRYKGWYLCLLENYVPDTGTDPRRAWNLILTEQPLEGSDWKETRTDDGSLMQATGRSLFRGWYLDCLHEAKVLERNRCWGTEKPRDRPAPPLAK